MDEARTDDVCAGARFWLDLRLPPRWYRLVIRSAPHRYQRPLVALWLRWKADGG
jgi:hypothetical protein